MLNVLVVDDSAFMRKLFKDSLEKDPQINVIDTARNGQDALAKINKIKPDVVTLDIEMPIKDGLSTLQEIMDDHPELPVIMVSALDNRDTVMQALEIGAFEFIPKPSGSISLNIDDIIDELQEKIKVSVKAKTEQNKKNISARINPPRYTTGKDNNYSLDNFPIIAIGSSSGGPKALKDVITALPGDLPAAIAIVQHMPAGFTTSLAKRLDQQSPLNVKEAEPGDALTPGQVLIAPGDYHLTFNDKGVVELNQDPKKWGVRPCVDYMFTSLAPIFQARLLGIILTGMGHDGGVGMTAIKKHSGYGIVEDESTALVYGMPGTTIEAGAYDIILPRYDIPVHIVKQIKRR
ncbi:MAG: protein-glutamate methylesterase/protein-glutamine glutaminase [Bacillota bacterium]